jgi:hypothetical protein
MLTTPRLFVVTDLLRFVALERRDVKMDSETINDLKKRTGRVRERAQRAL